MKIVKLVSVSLILTIFILRLTYIKKRLLPFLLLAHPRSSQHALVVVIIPRRIWSLVEMFYLSQERSIYKLGGLMNSTVLQLLQRAAQKAYQKRGRFSWEYTRARYLFREKLPGLGPICSTL